jgi:hypothetical protein
VTVRTRRLMDWQTRLKAIPWSHYEDYVRGRLVAI